MPEDEKQTQIIGVSVMKEENVIARALPFPQPRFWFGTKVVNTMSGPQLENFYWRVGTVTGLNWNYETKKWQYIVFWEEDREESDPNDLGYNKDQLLMSECDLYYE